MINSIETVDADCKISETQDGRTVYSVKAPRLEYQFGDIAKAMDIQIPGNGRCKRPVKIADAWVAVIAGAGHAMMRGYTEMLGYRLRPIDEYSGELTTFEEIMKAQEHLPMALPRTGIIVECPQGQYVLAEQVAIRPISEASK